MWACYTISNTSLENPETHRRRWESRCAAAQLQAAGWPAGWKQKIRLPNMEPNRAEDFRLRRRIDVIEIVNYREPLSSTYPTMATQ